MKITICHFSSCHYMFLNYIWLSQSINSVNVGNKTGRLLLPYYKTVIEL